MSGGASIAVSPGAQDIFLLPSTTYEGEFSILNPFTDDGSIRYTVKVAPFTVEDEHFTLDFEDKTDASQIVDWITLETSEGVLEGHAETVIRYKITVPEDAPAGGQYAAFLVRSEPAEASTPTQENVSIRSTSQVAMLLYSTVAGETRTSGEVLDNSVNMFYLGTPIKVSSLLKNTGNVHIPVAYTLKIFPLFSGEEVFTNEENPARSTLIPNTSLYSEKTWEETPLLGVYRVVQEISFAGETDVRETISLVCPLWFLFLILAFLGTIIYWFIDRTRKRKVKKYLEKAF